MCGCAKKRPGPLLNSHTFVYNLLLYAAYKLAGFHQDGFQYHGKLYCYISQLKYVSWLEETVSRAIGQNSMTP